MGKPSSSPCPGRDFNFDLVPCGMSCQVYLVPTDGYDAPARIHLRFTRKHDRLARFFQRWFPIGPC
jgi:hypothetical protein